MCKGNGLTKEMLPFVPGYEFIGRVHAVSPKAEDWGYKTGDRVAGMSLTGGSNSNYFSVPCQRLALVSEGVDAAKAACLVHDYAAALEALLRAKRLAWPELHLEKPAGTRDEPVYPFEGKKLLVTDGHSPAGRAAIDLALSDKFEVYAGVEPEHAPRLRALGVTCFDRDPLPKVRGKMNVVIDNSLACTDFYGSSQVALAEKGGLVALVTADDKSRHSGSSWDGWARKWTGIKAGTFMSRTAFVDAETCFDEGTHGYPRDNLTKSYRKVLRCLVRLLELGKIDPTVAKRVSLDEVPEAQKLAQSGKECGTVVCVP
ncbi:hypothetical protein ACHAWF_008086 [Thalassiosira exigua]